MPIYFHFYRVSFVLQILLPLRKCQVFKTSSLSHFSNIFPFFFLRNLLVGKTKANKVQLQKVETTENEKHKSKGSSNKWSPRSPSRQKLVSNKNQKIFTKLVCSQCLPDARSILKSWIPPTLDCATAQRAQAIELSTKNNSDK